MIYLIILIYALGAVLSYGRVVASFYDLTTFNDIKHNILWLVLCSWSGFIVGVFVYYQYKDKYFLKWSFNK